MKWYGWPFGAAPRGELESAVVHPSYRADDGREVATLLGWDGEAWPTLTAARVALLREMRRCGDLDAGDIAEAGRIAARDAPIVYDYRKGD